MTYETFALIKKNSSSSNTFQFTILKNSFCSKRGLKIIIDAQLSYPRKSRRKTR